MQIPLNRITQEHISRSTSGRIFVFGSNIAGRHGKGAALEAKKNHGAIPGRGWGPQGRSYAIPTKDGRPGIDTRVSKVLSLEEIQGHVNKFIEYAKRNPELIFDVLQIGCGNAGYTPKDMAPLFKDAIEVKNICLPVSFWAVLEKMNDGK